MSLKCLCIMHFVACLICLYIFVSVCMLANEQVRGAVMMKERGQQRHWQWIIIEVQMSR